MRATLKIALNGLAIVAALPSWLLYRLQASLLGQDVAFAGWSQVWSLCPGLIGVFLRRAFLRLAGVASMDCHIGFGTLFSHSAIRIGHRVYIGNLNQIGAVDIGDDVLISSKVSILNGGRQHGIDGVELPIRDQIGEYRRLSIGCNSWIGEQAIVMANIGYGCVVGAGAVVTRPVPDLAVVVGNPARILRYRPSAAPTTEFEIVSSDDVDATNRKAAKI